MHATTDDFKRLAGYTAVDRFVRDGACIGLGTGSTAFWAIARVGERVAAGARIVVVPTSLGTERLCRERGVPVAELADHPIEVAIDGADEVAPDGALIKGGGGALFREKAVAIAAGRFVVIVTEEKLVARLGRFPLPVEVVPFSVAYVAREIPALGATAVVRRGGEAPYVSDNGNAVLDCTFGSIADPAALDRALRALHGVVSTGLFVGLTSEVLVAGPDGVRSLAPAAP